MISSSGLVPSYILRITWSRFSHYYIIIEHAFDNSSLPY